MGAFVDVPVDQLPASTDDLVYHTEVGDALVAITHDGSTADVAVLDWDPFAGDQGVYLATGLALTSPPIGLAVVGKWIGCWKYEANDGSKGQMYLWKLPNPSKMLAALRLEDADGNLGPYVDGSILCAVGGGGFNGTDAIRTVSCFTEEGTAITDHDTHGAGSISDNRPR